MKKLLTVLMLTLALNFIGAVGAIGYFFKVGTLNREKIAAIKAVMYPATTQAVVEEKNDVPDATTQPTLRLEKLLASVSGRPAGEQVEFMQRTFDANMALLDRRQRDLADVLARIQSEQSKLQADRSTLLAQQKQLDAREKALKDQTEDKGFEDTLTLYNSMSAAQVKDIFSKLDDATVTKYLTAMDSSKVSKILKEFTSPADIERVQKWMEMIRQTPADDKGAATASTAGK